MRRKITVQHNDVSLQISEDIITESQSVADSAHI